MSTESGSMKGFLGGLLLTIVCGLLLVGGAWWLLAVLWEYPYVLLGLSSLSLLAILLYIGFVFFGFLRRKQTWDSTEQVMEQNQDSVEQTTEQAQEDAGGAAQQAQDAVEGQVFQQAQDTAKGAAQQAQEPARQAAPQAPGVPGSRLSVLTFNDPYGADRILVALQGLQERQRINLEDAAVVSWPQGNKKPTTRQLHSTAGAGALGGAFWGFLFGLIFFAPFLGAAIGAGMGALSGSMADVGISDDFIKQVRESVSEGTSALFLLTDGASAKFIDELTPNDFEIISTPLPVEQEMRLREAFTE